MISKAEASLFIFAIIYFVVMIKLMEWVGWENEIPRAALYFFSFFGGYIMARFVGSIFEERGLL